jgi:lipopolysaccharide export system protein LptA
MKSRLLSLSTLAFVGISAITQTLIAAPPTPMTEAEVSALQADAASRASTAHEMAATAEAALQTDLAASASASESATTFLAKADLPPIKTNGPPVTEAKPLDIPDDPNNTLISCDGGIYFDPDEGVLVYLKNVKVSDPRFDMTGANELKVFFEKKAPAPKKDKPTADGKKNQSDDGLGGDIGASIGDVERIIATGVIKIDQKPTDGKEPIQASGAIFTYNVKSGVATLSGGFPWVKQGARFFSSKKADNLLRIYPDESRFDTPGGGWNMGFPIPQKKKGQ